MEKNLRWHLKYTDMCGKIITINVNDFIYDYDV